MILVARCRRDRYLAPMLLFLLACTGAVDTEPTDTEMTATDTEVALISPITVTFDGEGEAQTWLADTTGAVTELLALTDAGPLEGGSAVLDVGNPLDVAVDDGEGNLLAVWMVGVVDGDAPLGAWPGYLAWSWLDGIDVPAWYQVTLDADGVHLDPFDPETDVFAISPNLVPQPRVGLDILDCGAGEWVDLYHLPTLSGEAPVDDPILATAQVVSGVANVSPLPSVPEEHVVTTLAGEETVGLEVAAYVGVLYDEVDGEAGIGEDDTLVASTVGEDSTQLLLHLTPTDLRAVLYPAAYGLEMGWSLYEVVGAAGAPVDWDAGLAFPSDADTGS